MHHLRAHKSDRLLGQDMPMPPVEIIPLSQNTFYIPAASNVGLYRGSGGTVLIDSGNDAETGRRYLRALEAAGIKPDAILLTHSNADHAGGAAFISSRTGASIYCSRIEAALCADPVLEPSFVWGAYPPKELRGKFFMAPPCRVNVTDATAGDTSIPGASALQAAFAGIRILALPGHFFSQQGYLADGVLFAGDALFGAESIAKHPVFFVYDVAAFLASLDRIAAAAPTIVLPSHGKPVHGPAELAELIAVNRAAIERVASTILEACSLTASPATPDEVLAQVCSRFGINLDWAQYALVGSTARSYLVYLRECGKLEVEFRDGKMVWGRV